MPDQKVRGVTPGLIPCDEFGRPYYQHVSSGPFNEAADMTSQENLAQAQSTCVENDPVPASWYEEQDKLAEQLKQERERKLDDIIEELKAFLPKDFTLPSVAMAILRRALQADPGYAWSWHCNLAMPIYDQGVKHSLANLAAARLMKHIFDVDTMTQWQHEMNQHKGNNRLVTIEIDLDDPDPHRMLDAVLKHERLHTQQV